MSETISVENMIAYVRHEHAYLDRYYVVEKHCDFGFFWNTYRIQIFNPERDKIISLKVNGREFEKLQLVDYIEFHDPLFERVCNITHDWKPETARFYREIYRDHPTLRPEKFVDDLREEAEKQGITLWHTSKKTIH